MKLDYVDVASEEYTGYCIDGGMDEITIHFKETDVIMSLIDFNKLIEEIFENEKELDKKRDSNLVYKGMCAIPCGGAYLSFKNCPFIKVTQKELTDLIADLKLYGCVSLDDIIDELLNKHEEVIL